MRTLYNYIDEGALSIKNIDLRRKTGYKPRKKKYNDINGFHSMEYRQCRTYEDFEYAMKFKYSEDEVTEMDTVKGVRESGKRLLTMIFRKNNVMLLFLMPDGKAKSVKRVFDYLETGLGIDVFRRLFPVILTDNGSEFKKVDELGAVNAGRGSYKLAQAASKIIADTKSKIRQLVHLDSSAVVFAPSITIAINQIVNGLDLRKNAVIYVSPYEHNAVARSIYTLSKKMKFTVKELPVNDIFEIDIEKMKYEFSKDKPEAVFCTHVSNVTGYVLPIEEIFCESKKQGSINILDSAQSMGLIDIRADLIKVDIIAFAGHKTLYGPFGIGGFINVSGIKLNTFITGGTGTASMRVASIEDERVRDEELVMAIGRYSDFGLRGLHGLKANEWYRNIIVGDIEFSADDLLKYAFDDLIKQNSGRLPVNKYLSEAIGEYPACKVLAKKQNFDYIISQTIKDHRGILGDYKSVKQIWENEKESLEKSTRLIAHLVEENIDVNELGAVLKEIFENDINALQNSSPAIRTNIRRLIMIYDYLKWGK